ncbi:RNA polymerase sigma factor [Chitinophaga silvisoli]|uniref:Sigma-70 family RNA polymerase sigma factor n=1 Tax=Chitinophaga silvisoli TaxID=2291814 RepID=A0A3E1NTW7_9BACT|nr:sigma-70 family RNA polymerase sigma factor [Chitinophaga silvisoli]RFM31188.1 sigma-70 family RNA polymerase sigma factor [Chitinophaga silvisoli]
MEVGQNDDIQLWEQFCKGDKRAFDGLWAYWFPILFKYCNRFTDDKSLIKDVLQDFFIELFTSRSRRNNVQHVKSYLMIAVRRKLLRVISQQKARSTEDLGSDESYGFYLDLSADHPIIEQQELHNRKQVVQHVINGLSNRQREAIYLYFFENIGYEGIAEIMSMKEVKYARTLIYRALDEMRDVIARNKQLTGLL